jgi:hypothetical protein
MIVAYYLTFGQYVLSLEKGSHGRCPAAEDLRLRNKPISSRSKNTKKKELKPLPEAVLEKLEKKKAKLAKKLEKEERQKIRKPKQYKKRQKSYQYGMDSLSAQIEETKEEMEKSLKKRPIPPELDAIFKEEGKTVTKNEVGRNLRELALKAAKDRANKITEDQAEEAV